MGNCKIGSDFEVVVYLSKINLIVTHDDRLRMENSDAITCTLRVIRIQTKIIRPAINE